MHMLGVFLISFGFVLMVVAFYLMFSEGVEIKQLFDDKEELDEMFIEGLRRSQR
tara:strand:+ start:443 stop:604 length:162 start_codon:yes stop_codon:yes gene_type:complete